MQDIFQAATVENKADNRYLRQEQKLIIKGLDNFTEAKFANGNSN